MTRARFVEMVLPYLLSVAIMLGLWQLAATQVNPLFFPRLETVWRSFWSLASGDLGAQTLVSLARILAGFGIASLAAVPIGLLMGMVPAVHRLLRGPVDFFRFIPPIAMIVLAVAWFGASEIAIVFLIGFSTIFIVTINTEAGVLHVVRNRIRAAQMMGAGFWQVFWLVVLPSVIPHALIGMRIAMGAAFSTIVSAEMIAGDYGLGYLLQEARTTLRTGNIFVGIVLLGLLGIMTDRVFRSLIDRFGGEHAGSR